MTPRPRLCIPVFDNPATIGRVVADCLAETELDILVIDDGSAEPVTDLIAADPRVVILRHEKNRGKGAAIKSAFKRCIADGYTHAVTLDGDGQHLATELRKILSAVAINPWAMIVGERKLDKPTVPKISRFGRAFSNFWVRYETGKKVHDSQCGLRAYPLFFVQGVRFWTRGYEFEIEVLIRMLWLGVQICEVPIDVFYPRPDERVSHFRKFRDNLRISLLNSTLVTLRLIRRGFTPREGGLAVALGVFIGCTPFWGIHTLACAIASVLFRLNAGLLFLGAQVSLPIFAPALIIASVRLGAKMRGGTALPPGASLVEWAQSSFVDWFLGAIPIGLGLAFLLGGATYLGLQAAASRKRAALPWNGRMRGGVGNRVLKFVARRFGLGAAYFCLNFVVPYFYVFAPRARAALHEYWGVVRPEARGLASVRLVVAHMHRFAQLLLDRIAQSESPEPLFEVRSEGFDYIKDKMASGEGVILLGAHVGGWELASSYIHRHRLERPFYLVQHRADGLHLDTLKSDREKLPPAPVYANREPLPILRLHRLLDGGNAVALMGDRPVGKHFELVRFFGRLAPFDTTPFRLAAATGKPLVFAFGFKASRRHYDLYALPARYYRFTPGEDRTPILRDWAQDFARDLEARLRAYPDQWANFFPFWSTPPNKTHIAAMTSSTTTA